MIGEREIYEWFKGSVSSQRIDVVCGLLRLCLPLELRFVGACLEDLARRDYPSLREYELKSNDGSGYTTLANTTTPDELLQNTLNVYVSLLHSTNTVCANSLFQILEGLHDRLQLTLLQGLSGKTRHVVNENAAEDLLLLFTMAAHHPAFTFSQRIKICESLMNVKQVFGRLGLIKLCQKENDTAAARNSVENSLNLVASVTRKASDIGSYVTVLETRRNNKNRSFEFHLEANWPEFEMVQIWRSYKDLLMFHEKLEKHFSGVSGDESISCNLPQFPARVVEKNSHNDKQMSDALKIYFREIFSLPLDITEEDGFKCLFHDLFNKSDMAVVSASVSAASSPSLSVGKVQTSLSAPSSPHSASPSALTPSAKAVVSKLPNDSLVNLVVTISTSQLTSISLQSSRSNHLLESSTSGVSSSHSSPPSAQSSVFLPSQNARSRHNSSQGCITIGAWLKEIRLHKYAAQLAKYSWDELFNLTDADLQKEGFTSGACKKFANEIHLFKSRLGSNLESLSDSSNSSRPCNLTSLSASRQCAVPVAALISKSVAGVSSPGSIDSSCSDYFTPPGSPEPRHSFVNKPRTRAVFCQQSSMTSSAVKEKDRSESSKSAVVSRPSGITSSDVPVVQSISHESSLVSRYTAEPVGIRPIFAPTGDAMHCAMNPDEFSDGEITQSAPEKFPHITVAPVHESISKSQVPSPVVDMTHSAVDQMKVPVHQGMIALNPWHVNAQGQQVWSVSNVNVQPLIPHIELAEARAFCSGSLSEVVNLAHAHPEVEEVTLHPSGYSPRLPGHPVLDSPIVPPSLPIPSDAVLVRPRLPVGLPPIARIPAIVSTVTRFNDVATSNIGPVTDVVTKSCSPLATDMSANPHFPRHGPPPTVLYLPVSPAFHPLAGTQNKAGYLTPRVADLPDLTNTSPAVLTSAAFSVDHSTSAESRLVENQPSGMATFMPGFFGLQSPLPTPVGSLPMMHSGMPYSITVTSAVLSPVSHAVSQNVMSFPANDDPSVDDAICQHCGQSRRMIPYPNMWPVESMFPRSACFSVITPQHGSPQFRPLCGTQVPFQLQNGINPELHYQSSCTYLPAGMRPMHATRPGCAAPFPQYMFRCRTGAGVMASLSACSNCGSSGHSHLECKEQTIESTLGTGHFRLNIIPKTETG